MNSINPFAQPKAPSQPVNPFAAATQAPPTSNPFAQSSSGNASNSNPNPFGPRSVSQQTPQNTFVSAKKPQARSPFIQDAAPRPNPFATESTYEHTTPSSSGFAKTPRPRPPFAQESALKTNSFGNANQTQGTGRRSNSPAFKGHSSAPQSNGLKKRNEFPSAASRKRGSTPPITAPSGPSGRNSGKEKRKNAFRDQGRLSFPQSSNHGPSGVQSASPFGIKPRLDNTQVNRSSAPADQPPDEYKNGILKQLARDGIHPPAWPQNPGSRSQRKAMDAFRQAHKEYREKARKSLVRAKLIDDPEERKRLEDAIVFKGICEEMCPEWEKITRITEFDIKNAEKEDVNGELVAIPKKMVKRLARSAAGQEAPLPMDIRSPAALRRTLDYLIQELIPSDDYLPSVHNFLWDRTRAIRRDFIFQSNAMGPEEMLDYVYCLETIARFHVTALHLLSKPGFAAEDFDAHQEWEQLGKTLLSLNQAYDDCIKEGLTCENEAEFRSYYVVFNAGDPAITEKARAWGQDLAQSRHIQNAVCLVACMENTTKLHGPLQPPAPTDIALNIGSIFFSMIASSDISYTMACFAEIHFNSVRRSILETVKAAYSRPRDGPKDLTPALLKRKLGFDTEKEAVEFVEQHGLRFDEDMGSRYLVVNGRQQLEEPRLPHPFTRNLVERKRGDRSLPDVIYETVSEMQHDHVSSEEISEDDSLFVPADQPAAADLEDEPPRTTPPPALKSALKSSTLSAPQSSHFSNATASNPFAKPQEAVSFTTTDAASPFATSTNIFGSSTTETPLGSTGFAGFGSQKEDTQISVAQPGAQKAEKKVRFGRNSFLSPTVDAPTSPQASHAHGSSQTFTSISNQNTLSTGQSSWFPPKLPEPQSTSPSREHSATSIFSEALATAGEGLKSPSVGTSTVTQAQPTATTSTPSSSIFSKSSAAPSLFSNKQSETLTSTSTFPNQTSSIFSRYLANAEQTSSSDNAGPASLIASPPQVSAKSPYFSAPTAVNKNPTIKVDPFDNLTKWYVSGDRGLMQEQLQEWALEQILKGVYEDFKTAESERKRKEEEEESWAAARRYRRYSLKVTYFYRWLDIFRKRRAVKRIKMEREKARQWSMAENVAKRESAEKAAREKKGQDVTELLRRSVREDRRRRNSVRAREQSLETALRATGVFKGVRDEDAAIRDAASDEVSETFAVPMLPSESMRLRSENARRRKHGLPPINRLPQPRAYSPSSKTAKLRALAAGSDSTSMSTNSLRNSIWSSSYRSSLGYNNGRVAKARKTRSSDPYWRMKANGLVQMPNGDYLHESLAIPMLRDGKRFPGMGDFGLPPAASVTPSNSPSIRGDLLDHSPPSVLETAGRNLFSSSPVSNSGSKRKRAAPILDEEEDDDLAAYRSEASASVTNRKRARSSELAESDQDYLAQMDKLLEELEEETKI